MSSANTILIIDDEVNLRRTLALVLQKVGYSVTTAAHPAEALQCLSAGAYDLTFLDLQLPDTHGLTLLTQIRRSHPDMPVLILTAHATLDSAIEAVRRGARDYLLKPADPSHILTRVREIMTEQNQPQRRREIVAQIQALLAELQEIDGDDTSAAQLLSTIPATASTRFLRRGSLTLDLHTRHATLGDRFIPLSSSSFDYLVTLARHAPNPVSYETLAMQAQGYELSRVEAQELVRWRMHQLRQALEPDPQHPQYLVTVRSVGYRLAVE